MALVAGVVSPIVDNSISLADELNQQPADPSRPTSSYVHHNVKVDRSHVQGFGLFATGAINEGEVVAWEYADIYEGPNDNRPGKKIMTTSQIEERWPDQRERDIMVAYSYQVGEDAFLIPLRRDDLVITTYQNHSCDPNTWWADDFTLTARRNILPGEEVTFDYSTSESLENPEMPECFCGASVCRGRLDPLDYLSPVLIDRYGTHFISYLRGRQRNHCDGKNAVATNDASNPAAVLERHNDQSNSDALEQSKLAALAESTCCNGDEPIAEKFDIYGPKS